MPIEMQQGTVSAKTVPVEEPSMPCEDIYQHCPTIENPRVTLRPVSDADVDDLLAVYSDKRALPFFNSDNCHGDNFYYPTRERMARAIDFWRYSYEQRYFVRWAIVDKATSKAIGTIELFRREADDDLGGVGVLRLDVGSAYESAEILRDILDLIVPPAFDWFDCDEIITKIPLYAVERAAAAKSCGFAPSDRLLIGTSDHYAYNGYWSKGRAE